MALLTHLHVCVDIVQQRRAHVCTAADFQPGKNTLFDIILPFDADGTRNTICVCVSVPVCVCVCVCVVFVVMSWSLELKKPDRAALFETGFRA